MSCQHSLFFGLHLIQFVGDWIEIVCLFRATIQCIIYKQQKNENKLGSKEGGTHPVLQCAAVRTQYLCTRDPTQKCWPFGVCKDTIYLTACGDAA